MASIHLTINAKSYTVDAEPQTSLLSVLREQLDLTGSKYGCGEGQCGACTVLIDGKPMLACVTPAAKVAGKTVTSLEGLEPKMRETLSECFVAAGGLQCSFCIPGIAMRTKAIIDKNPAPTREEISRGLVAHLCRCTGYSQMYEAIRSAVDAEREAATLAK